MRSRCRCGYQDYDGYCGWNRCNSGSCELGFDGFCNGCRPIVVILMNYPNVQKKNWRRYAKANRCFKKRKTVLGKYACYAWNHLCEDNENQIYDNQQDW